MRLPSLSARSRWRLRRAIALVCLVLAAASWVSERSAASRRAAASATAVPPGTTAVPVRVYAAGAALVHPGDRVDLVAPADDEDPPGRSADAPPVVLARGVQVVSVRPGAPDGDPPVSQLVVAADHDTAVRLAVRQGAAPSAVVLSPP